MSFIKFDGVDGESTIKGFEKWILIGGASWGLVRNIQMSNMASSNRGEGTTDFMEFTFTTEMNKATTKLSQACASGQIFDKVEYALVKSGGDASKSREAYSTWTMENVLVTSYNISFGADMVPMENITLSMLHMKHEYKSADQKTGALSTSGTFSWKVEEGVM